LSMNFAALGLVSNDPGNPDTIPADAGGAPTDPGTIRYDAGTRTVEINLGDITNLDDDADAEQVIVTFQVVVTNEAVNSLGVIWTNDFDVSVAGNAPVTSNEVSGVIQEPVVDIVKSINTTLSIPT